MSGRSADELRTLWITNAERLDRQGHFGGYSPRQRAEVLKKGYIGSWPPDLALKTAKELTESGHFYVTPQFTNDMRDLGFVAEGAREARRRILDELRPERYRPPAELHEPPGHPFILDCRTTGCRLYFKFQICGKRAKPRVLFWSCHPPVFRTERD